VEITDNNGNVVPDANNMVKLTIKSGSIIGFDNGNPRDHTSMKSLERNTFNGMALAVVQAGLEPGVIEINATSPGIRNAVIVLMQTPKKNK
jgi:beta-galactosidase